MDGWMKSVKEREREKKTHTHGHTKQKVIKLYCIVV
jgi:hypothetical protein